MSEEATQAPAKKGKLPIVVVLLLVVGGGGFFAFKMKAGGKKPKPVVELGTVAPLAEFLVNLSDNGSYIRTEISIQFAKGVEPKKLDDNLAAVRDAIIMKVTSKSANDLRTLDGKRELKREIAAEVNKVLDESDEKAKKPDAAKTPLKVNPDGTIPVPTLHPDWESDTGPVLRVFFTSLTTQ